MILELSAHLLICNMLYHSRISTAIFGVIAAIRFISASKLMVPICISTWSNKKQQLNSVKN